MCISAEHSNIKLSEYLISKGASLKNGPLATATLNGNIDIVKLLIQHGADPNDRNHDHTALGGAIMKGDKEMVKFLISKGADINRKDNWDITPLSLAIMEKQTEIIEVLKLAGGKE